MNSSWHSSADVVVVGYGLAGAVTAIVAHDAGAKVLLLEKNKYPGGISIQSGGFIKCAKEVEPAVEYLTHLTGGRSTPELIRGFATGLTQVESFMQELAKIDGARFAVLGYDPHHWREGMGAYPYPGGDNFYVIRVSEVPGFKGFPWIAPLSRFSVNMFKMVMDNIEARKIEVLLETSTQRLLTDASGAVRGVEALSGGQQLRIGARRAVVLATGGFESNSWLLERHLQGKPFYTVAPPTHSGDGILMAQKVGAAIGGMWHVHGCYGFKMPGNPKVLLWQSSGLRNPNRTFCWILVDKFGSRYMDEVQPMPADTTHRAMEIFDPDLPGYPRIPSYAIFDEEGRKSRRLMTFTGFGFENEERYKWSKDNLAEIEKGWIMKAESLRELSRKIKEDPHNEGYMDPHILESTVSIWNKCVEQGRDPLHRPPGTMMPIRTSPFYAMQMWPVVVNTQGGPIHNQRQQVLDAFREPILRLYAVGELGSFFSSSNLYEIACNLPECLISGWTAGAHAAEESPAF